MAPVEDHGRAVGEARRGRLPHHEGEVLPRGALERAVLAAQVHQEPGVLEQTRELGGHGLQGPGVRFGEVVGRRVLDHEHPHGHLALAQGHGQKGAEGLLARLAEVLEARVARRVPHQKRLRPLDRGAHEPRAVGHAHLPDGGRMEPPGGFEHELAALLVAKVNGADLRFEPLGHHHHGAVQEVPDVGALPDHARELSDVAKQVQVVAFHGSHSHVLSGARRGSFLGGSRHLTAISVRQIRFRTLCSRSGRIWKGAGARRPPAGRWGLERAS